MSTIAAAIGRILVAILFVVSGLMKLANPAPAATMLSAVGLSPALTLPTALFELGLGILLAIGMMTRLAAILLAGFTVLTILFFHNEFNDPSKLPGILMHVALVGGLLGLFAHGQMRWSYDALRERRAREIAEREREAGERLADRDRAADERVHQAELRAARAEARVDNTVPPESGF